MENKENDNRNLTGENVVVANKVRNAKKEGLTRGVLITGIIAVLILIVSLAFVFTNNKKEHIKQLALMDNQRTSFTKELSARDSIINEWLVTFDQIEKDMNLIKQKENLLTVKSSDSEISKNQREQIVSDMKSINTLLDNNRKKIASLNAQLKSSGTTIKGLQTRVAALETTLKEYENNIAELRDNLAKKDIEISQMNTQMTALQTTVTEKDSKINDQTLLLNQVFITSGTYKELKDKGIVTKEGGFLGLGRKETLAKNLDENSFSMVDVRDTRVIPVNSKGVKLITNHPAGSYELVKEGDNRIASIEITNPEMFWKVSRYAVVEIVR